MTELVDLPSEEAMLAGNLDSFEFMGWRFRMMGGGVGTGTLCCFKPLINPFPPGAYYSFHCFRVLEVGELTGTNAAAIAHYQEMIKKEAAAWLIAHWYEHALILCPCQTDAERENEDHKPSNFRRALISSLLWYDKHLSEPVEDEELLMLADARRSLEEAGRLFRTRIYDITTGNPIRIG